MKILTLAVVSVATVWYGVGTSADFTTVTTKTLQNHVMDIPVIAAVRKHCNRLAICAEKDGPRFEVMLKGEPGNKKSPKHHIVFDVSIVTSTFFQAAYLHHEKPAILANDA